MRGWSAEGDQGGDRAMETGSSQLNRGHSRHQPTSSCLSRQGTMISQAPPECLKLGSPGAPSLLLHAPSSSTGLPTHRFLLPPLPPSILRYS